MFGYSVHDDDGACHSKSFDAYKLLFIYLL